MDYSPKGTILLHMEQLTNEELLNIWVKNDRDEYSEKTFVVIHDILLNDRGVSVPMQKEFTETEQENNNMTILGFFSFQTMISSKLIQIIYVLGAFGITFASSFIMREQFLYGILGIIVGNLVWRLICETAIIFFRINEQLGMINQELKRSVNRVGV